MNFSYEKNDSINDIFNATNGLNFTTSSEKCSEFNTSQEIGQIGNDIDQLVHFVTYGILLNSISIFGIFGNVISMIVLSRPQMKSSINYLFIGLARCDTVFIITCILLYGLPAIYPSTGYLFTYHYQVYPLIAPFVYPIAMISQTVSVYLTLIVTVERFVAVCHPLKARYVCTYRRARLNTIFVIIFSILYNISRFWEVGVMECEHDKYNVPIYRVYPTNLRNDGLYIKIYIHWMYLIFMYFIPFGFLSVLNTSIYLEIRKANQQRQHLSRLQKKEIALAKMLLCIVVVFFICNLLALVSNVLEAFYSLSNDFLVEMGNLMITIHSSVNFVIYIIFGEKFKRLFSKLFFPHGLRFCGCTIVGRDSSEQIRVDSYCSDGSLRERSRTLSTSYSKNGTDKSQNDEIRRVSSRGSCIYYPARDNRGSWEHCSTTGI